MFEEVSFGERYGCDKEGSMLGEVGEKVEGGLRSKSKKVSKELGRRGEYGEEAGEEVSEEGSKEMWVRLIRQVR